MEDLRVERGDSDVDEAVVVVVGGGRAPPTERGGRTLTLPHPALVYMETPHRDRKL
jgi:hypothetical protein